MSTAGTSVGTGTVLADRWVLSERVGTGASSHVYAARDLKLDRWVAVKVMHPSLATDPTFIEQFRNEAGAVSALEADHVVRFYDAGNHDIDGLQVPYIVSALMTGGSLEGMLLAGRRLDVAQAIAVAAGAARGLEVAHAAGIVHRDVKPSNLLFDTEGNVALSDFGISRAIAAATSTEPIGPASATARYASPEQMQGRAVDDRSDMYSLALVLIESVTGVVPLLADSIAGTAARRAETSVDVSVDFGALREPLLSASEADPLRRCNAAEFLAALEVASERVGPAAPLELALVEGLDEQTSELRVGSDDAGLVVLGAGAAGVAAGLAPEPAWGADSISVADEHARLTQAKPSELGPVPPLEAASAPGAVSGLGGAEPPKKAKQTDRRSKVTKSLLIVLAVLLVAGAAVAGWWFLIRVPTHEVPPLVGGQLTAAGAAAETNSWEVEVVERTRVDGTVADEVIEQSPAAGTQLAEGESLALRVSNGPTLTVLPQVSGLPEPEAQAALDSAGLVLGTRTTQFNEDAAAGIVLLFAPAEGLQPDSDGQVPNGTAVDIIVSDGPAPRVVPGGLVGATQS
ncbi:MAG: protein kinase domain-containing protein, partial [Microthrixaceae bacterium]